MLPSSILSEAWRNTISGTNRAVLFAALFMVTIGLIAFMDVRSVVTILQGAAQFNTAGATVQVLTAASSIDGQRCNNLTGVGQISQAGAIRKGTSVTVLNMPGTPVSVIEVTPGVIAMLPSIGQPTHTGTSSAGGVWLSADLAQMLGAIPGTLIHTSVGITTVAGVYTWPDDGRARDLGYVMVTPVPPDGVFDQCWTQIWPPDQNLGGLTYMALNSGGGMQATFNQLNTTLGSTYNPTSLLNSRLTAHAAWVASIIGLALGFAATRIRRLEIASTLHAGMTKTDLACQHVTETLAWTICASLITAAGLLWAARIGNPDPDPTTWQTGVRSILAAASSTPIGTITAITTTREQHLFQYSKDR